MLLSARGVDLIDAWPLRAAHELGIPAVDAPYPAQYLRGAWR